MKLKHLFDKDYRAYAKMRRRHRRELVRLAKKSEEFDFGYLHVLVKTKLGHFLEYYEAGNNVHHTDESIARVIGSLKHALALAEKIENDESIPPRMDELYGEFYSYVGENITS